MGLLSLLCGGCGKQPAAQSPASPDVPVLKVTVFADGRLTVDGTASTIQAFRESLRSLSEKHGMVWYYRENGQQQPPPIASEVVQAVIDAKLPIRLSSRPDYSDSIEHGGRTPEGAIVFLVADVALVPGEHWKEVWSGPLPFSKDIRPPVLQGEGEFKGVYISVMADPTDQCSTADRAAKLRKEFEAEPELVPGSLTEDQFTTDAGLAGIHFAFDEQSETNGKKVKRHNSFYIVQNAHGVCVHLVVSASGVGHEPTDLGSTDQMIRKTLRWTPEEPMSTSSLVYVLPAILIVSHVIILTLVTARLRAAEKRIAGVIRSRSDLDHVRHAIQENLFLGVAFVCNGLLMMAAIGWVIYISGGWMILRLAYVAVLVGNIVVFRKICGPVEKRFKSLRVESQDASLLPEYQHYLKQWAGFHVFLKPPKSADALQK
jgi:hypothetical protein